jgi:flavin-dependent dehydrogenase
MSEAYDCVIMGGGPAGATSATLLADHGHRVLVLEKARFPRHSVGESLMPESYWVFERLGMLDKMKTSAFPKKESVQFVSASGKESQPFFFADRDSRECSVTWQVRRDEFDRLMLDNAREHGAEVREGVLVKDVRFTGSRAVGVRASVDDETVDFPARVVVDATGQTSLLSNKLNLRDHDEALRNGAIYAYYKGAYRDEGRNAGATVVIHTPDRSGWFWSIPLPDDVTSVGLVAPPAHLFNGRGGKPLNTLQEEIQMCPNMAERLAGAERISDARVLRDFSYRSRRVAGDGWVLVGDAFGFLDPVYSSGVMLAMKSGALAADAIHEALLAGDLSGERLGVFGPELAHGMQMIRQLVHAFYSREFSFSQFISQHPECKDHLVRILIGDVFNDEVAELFDRMRGWIEIPEPIELEGGVAAP